MSTATRITIAEYDRMIADGVFDSKATRPRIELIEGELRPMSPIGPLHEDVVDILTEWAVTSLPRARVRVRIQNSIGIPELQSAPEPDLVCVKRRSYRTGRPLPADVLLVVEVSDSSLDYDRGQKAGQFAAAGIADYWVVNIPDLCIEVFRQPDAGQYSSREIFKPGDEIHPLAFPQVAMPVALLFAPQSP